MSIQETHEWAKERMAEWDGLAEKMRAQDPALELGKQKRVGVPPYAQFDNHLFYGDITIRDGDLFFHFFPKEGHPFGEIFPEALGDAFTAVFKHVDRLFWDFVPELNSWVVRCAGFGDNPLLDQVADRVLVKIKSLLGICQTD